MREAVLGDWMIGLFVWCENTERWLVCIDVPYRKILCASATGLSMIPFVPCSLSQMINKCVSEGKINDPKALWFVSNATQ